MIFSVLLSIFFSSIFSRTLGNFNDFYSFPQRLIRAAVTALRNGAVRCVRSNASRCGAAQNVAVTGTGAAVPCVALCNGALRTE